MAFSGIALLIPAMAMRGVRSGPALFATFFLLLGAAYCVAGYLVRKQRLAGGWVAVVVAVLLSAIRLRARTLAGSIGLLVNIAVIVLVAANWRHLRTSSPVGA